MKSKRNALDVLLAAVYVALGAVLAVYPERLIHAVCLGLGIITLLYGVARLIGHVTNRRGNAMSYVDLGIGVLFAGIGVVLISTPGIVVSIIPFVVGFIVIITAVAKMQQALELRDLKYEKWWLMMVTGCLMMLLGGYLVLNPFESATIMLRVVGIALIINGVCSLLGTGFTSFTIHRYKRNEDIHGPGPESHARDEQTGEELLTDVVDADGRVIR